MKRGIQVLMLLLLVLTSLNAGTLAIYTSTVDLAVLQVSAKRFALDVNQGGQSEFDLKIAPGELVSYQFDVSNVNADGKVSEVDMDLLVEADFSNIRSTIPGVTIQLLLFGSSGYAVVAQADEVGHLGYSKSQMFTSGESGVRHFSITFYWDNGESARALLEGSRIILPLTLYVKGVQHVE